MKKRRKVKGKSFILLICLVCVFTVGLLYANGNIGIMEFGLESDIRSQQLIPDDWQITGEASETMAAFIVYPENVSDYAFSVYVNYPGLSFGYFFRSGGALVGAEKSIGEYRVEGCRERAFISTNMPKVERLEIDDGNSVRTVPIDSGKPFAIVVPDDAKNICFYDVNGNEVGYVSGK